MSVSLKPNKSQSKPMSNHGYIDNGSENEEEEPPGGVAACSIDEEPPSSNSKVRKYFSHIPDSIWNDWKWQFRNRITSVNDLIKFIPLSPIEQDQIKLVIKKYPFSVTPHYLSLIDPNDPDDPIKKQAIPSILEITMGMVGMEDPLEETRDSVVPGLVHRYSDRVLMVLTDICPMLCRHCTRKREWKNGGWVRTPNEVEAMLDYIRRHKGVRDVIISGGDPLTLSTSHLENVISQIRSIKHVEVIRIGTRYPVVLPQRIDDELCAMLSKYGPIWLNTHFNHYREITPESAAACDKLLRSGVPVNNQSVLLHGVNDTLQTQLKLCNGLLKIKVRPYYIFQCDEVQGTEHLRTPVEVGVNIIKGMRGHTSGLAIPNFVIDLPYGGGKVPLQANYIMAKNNNELVLENYQGKIFRYRNPKIIAGSKLNAEAAKTINKSVAEMIEVSGQRFEFKGAQNENRVIVRS